MSTTSSRLAVVLALATVPLAGCFGGDEALPSNIEVTASQPHVSRGWAYDGQGVLATNGSARLVADDSRGSGGLTANLTLSGTSYTVSAGTFEGDPAKPWQANGVNQSVRLHGDTGRGSPALPSVNAVVATWGPVQVSRADETLADPLTGQPQFYGRIVVTDAGVRSDDGRILAQDGSLYAPSKAGSGQTFPGDEELLVAVTSPPGMATYNDSSVADSGQLTPQQPNASLRVQIQQSTADLNTSVSVASPGASQLPPAETNVSLVSPAGSQLKAVTLGGTGNRSVSWSFATLPGTGNYSLEVESQGTVDWNASATVDYAEPFALRVVYETASWRAAS